MAPWGKEEVVGREEEEKDLHLLIQNQTVEFLDKGGGEGVEEDEPLDFKRDWDPRGRTRDNGEIRSVEVEDGLLTIVLGRIVPDHHQKKVWF